MVARFQPSRLITPLLLFLVVIAASYLLNPEPWRHLSVSLKVYFAGIVLFFIALIALLRNKMYLRIDERGLEIKYVVGSPRFYTWSDIESARIFKVRFLLIPLTSSIHLQLRPGLRSSNPVRKAAGALTGSSTSFPSFFDESAEEIVEKINFFKRQGN